MMKVIFKTFLILLLTNSLVSQDLSALYQKSIKSVVTIYTTEFKFSSGKINPSQSLGSGVIIDKNGLIMTAAHVIETANVIKVKLHNGNTYDAQIIRSIPSADIALVKIIEEVPGGGPMFNMNGDVIGIVSYILSQSGGFDGIGYVVDVRTAKELLLDDDSHFWSGFDGYFLDENLSAILNVPQKAGLLIQRVTKGSFADKMGLQAGFFQAEILDQKLWLGGDIILDIMGSSCASPHSLDEVKNEIEILKPGESIYLKVLRQGHIVELKQTLE